LWRLGAPTFWDPDEAHYAETSRELILTGDWPAPYYNQQPFFDKPILFHWLQSTAMRLTADPEQGARLVPALASVVLVWITWWLGTRLAGPDVARTAALLLSVNPGVFTLSRYAILDTLFSAFLFGGVSLVAVAALRNRPRLQYPGYVLVGLATFTKGPVALVLCGVGFALSIALSRDARQRLLSLRWIVGLGIAIAVPLPWFVYMLWRFGDAFIQGYFLNENVLLFATPLYANQPPWWFYLGILATGLLPWTALIVGRLIDQGRALVRGRQVDTFDVFLWSWTIGIVAFFSFSKFKLDHYVFPTAPALCLICARAWIEARTSMLGAANKATGIGLRLVGPTLIAAGAGVAGFMLWRLHLPPDALVVAAGLAAAGVWATVRYRPGRAITPGVPAVPLAALGLTYVGLLFWVIPAIERGKVIPDVASWVSTRATAADRVATFRLNRWNPAYRFYVNRHTQMLDSDEDARRFFSDPSPYYCVMTRPLYEALRAAGVPLKIVYQREGLWVTSGRVLWRERPEMTEFVVTTAAASGAP
jgi:4-amino-4-deoxy-L-arabinose transferase-like glycosyltransferase